MEGKSLWIQEGDVDGRIEPGNVVTAARELSDWCLRGDDGSEPVQPGTTLEVVDVRPWGAAQAVEIVSAAAPADEAPAIMGAMVELEAEGLWEFDSETHPEPESAAAAEPDAIGLDTDRAAQIVRMARMEKQIAADEWGAYRELKELGVPAVRLPQPGLPGAVGVRERVSSLLDGSAPRYAEVEPASELRELIADASEAVQVHLDVRERLLTVSVDGWSLRDRVPWAETAAHLLRWIIEQVRETLRVRRAVVEFIAENPVSGPLVSPLEPAAILAGAAS